MTGSGAVAVQLRIGLARKNDQEADRAVGAHDEDFFDICGAAGACDQAYVGIEEVDFALANANEDGF